MQKLVITDPAGLEWELTPVINFVMEVGQIYPHLEQMVIRRDVNGKITESRWYRIPLRQELPRAQEEGQKESPKEGQGQEKDDPEGREKASRAPRKKRLAAVRNSVAEVPDSGADQDEDVLPY